MIVPQDYIVAIAALLGAYLLYRLFSALLAIILVVIVGMYFATGMDVDALKAIISRAIDTHVIQSTAQDFLHRYGVQNHQSGHQMVGRQYRL